MKLKFALFSVLMLNPFALRSQSFPVADNAVAPTSSVTTSAATTAPAVTVKPFSRVAVLGGISLMGVNLQAATNVSQHFNLRGVGNVFDYTINNISANGFNLNGEANFATAGVALDYYPFARHGFRLSPGFFLLNQNAISASGIVPSGSSFTLDNTNYFSADPSKVPGATPITVNAQLGLNAHKQAFTMTTGWGNMISRKGGHFSFPIEIGAAFVGAPTVGVNLSGWACNSVSQSAQTCANLASNSTITAELNKSLSQQISTWEKDLDPLKVYPIFSFGVSYNFRIR